MPFCIFPYVAKDPVESNVYLLMGDWPVIETNHTNLLFFLPFGQNKHKTTFDDVHVPLEYCFGYLNAPL